MTDVNTEVGVEVAYRSEAVGKNEELTPGSSCRSAPCRPQAPPLGEDRQKKKRKGKEEKKVTTHPPTPPIHMGGLLQWTLAQKRRRIYRHEEKTVFSRPARLLGLPRTGKKRK